MVDDYPFPGVILDARYEIVDRIGAGTYASVHLARALASPDCLYAIKVLSKSGLSMSQLCRQRAEASLHARASSHPNVVQFVELMETPAHLFLVMEYCPLMDLYENITGEEPMYPDEIMWHEDLSDLECDVLLRENRSESGGFLREATVRNIFLQLAAAVSHLHTIGIFHRDLKPENVLFARGCEVKLADFGLATCDDWSEDVDTGSVPYMAPETLSSNSHRSCQCHRRVEKCAAVQSTPVLPSLQCHGHESGHQRYNENQTVENATRPQQHHHSRVNHGNEHQHQKHGYDPSRADVWSLAIILLNVRYGHSPWLRADGSDASYSAYLRDPMLHLQRIFSHLSHDFAALLTHALHPDPSQRASLSEFISEFNQCASLSDTTLAFPQMVSPCSASSVTCAAGSRGEKSRQAGPSSVDVELDLGMNANSSKQSNTNNSSHPISPKLPPEKWVVIKGSVTSRSHSSISSPSVTHSDHPLSRLASQTNGPHSPFSQSATLVAPRKPSVAHECLQSIPGDDRARRLMGKPALNSGLSDHQLMPAAEVASTSSESSSAAASHLTKDDTLVSFTVPDAAVTIRHRRLRSRSQLPLHVRSHSISSFDNYSSSDSCDSSLSLLSPSASFTGVIVTSPSNVHFTSSSCSPPCEEASATTTTTTTTATTGPISGRDHLFSRNGFHVSILSPRLVLDESDPDAALAAADNKEAATTTQQQKCSQEQQSLARQTISPIATLRLRSQSSPPESPRHFTTLTHIQNQSGHGWPCLVDVGLDKDDPSAMQFSSSEYTEGDHVEEVRSDEGYHSSSSFGCRSNSTICTTVCTPRASSLAVDSGCLLAHDAAHDRLGTAVANANAIPTPSSSVTMTLQIHDSLDSCNKWDYYSLHTQGSNACDDAAGNRLFYDYQQQQRQQQQQECNYCMKKDPCDRDVVEPHRDQAADATQHMLRGSMMMLNPSNLQFPLVLEMAGTTAALARRPGPRFAISIDSRTTQIMACAVEATA